MSFPRRFRYPLRQLGTKGEDSICESMLWRPQFALFLVARRNKKRNIKWLMQLLRK